MKHQEEIPGFEELKKRLLAEQENFKKQFEEVKKQYPLVAFALSLQDVARAELSPVGAMAELPMSVLYDSLTGRIMEMRRLPGSRWLALMKAYFACVAGEEFGTPMSEDCMEKMWRAMNTIYE